MLGEKFKTITRRPGRRSLGVIGVMAVVGLLAITVGVALAANDPVGVSFTLEVNCPPKTDPSRMRGSVEKEAKNAKRKKIHTRTNHHQIAGSRGAAKPGNECRRSSSDTRDCAPDLLSMAERIWGYEYNTGAQTERPGKREPATQEVGG